METRINGPDKNILTNTGHKRRGIDVTMFDLEYRVRDHLNAGQDGQKLGIIPTKTPKVTQIGRRCCDRLFWAARCIQLSARREGGV